MVSVGSTTDIKPMRADAARNRDKLLRVATQAFIDRGAEASLDQIARDAGVGIGTLYRHFPTREDLVMAVYARQIDSLRERSQQLLAEYEPAEALHQWMLGFVDFYAVKNGMVTLLRSMMQASPDAFAEARASMRESAERVLRPAAEAGAIRSDVGAEEVLRALGGICLAGPNPSSSDATRTLVDLVFDGLRYGAPSRA
ncbi:TetR/AcrR family transcriptional regulator [Luteipulveratus sp. YIM 133132]|uniref:TetR/AcrR family transcriptional regulator n=1 Tax=Luteipulveratus flavus TaxID=3031728 RepID=A0ABT6C523_9MICO|nr:MULTISPECIES: TetR/AcrR family transcriptional regulator [unclassified Luteipulveratus]MDE9365358.1 TetR/AcrR family transcriptional regulator [Luteipulveratus sp. YIM 133132]MDF8263860.1 TetR/AcrR family transcriptional regulator [Luteipulveratus sp. YIM 133296]